MTNLKRRIAKLEVARRENLIAEFDREAQGRSVLELGFFAKHGYWPETAEDSTGAREEVGSRRPFERKQYP